MFIKSVLSGTQQGAKVLDVEYLVIAGGGGGAGSYGGGGAGGYRSSVTGESSGGGASAESVFKASFDVAYTVTVGAGGSGGSALSFGSKGANSSLSTIVSEGGGFGAYDEANGGDGGSGGGASGGSSSPQTFGGSPTSGQGYKGGDHLSQSSARGAGGGGAGEAGQDASNANTAGDGGNGIESLITGSATYRAGGGGGASTTEIGTGGLGGGGDGSRTTTAEAGSANTGGGGGGGGYDGTHRPGGAGGSGVVILRVSNTVTADFSAGVVYNYIPVDGFHVYEITGAGVSDTVTFIDNGPDAVTINDSLRFNDDDSAYLSRTPASAGNRKTWTWSGWVKRGNLGGYQDIFTQASGAASDTEKFNLRFNFDKISVDAYSFNFLVTTPIFRDPSSWYHVVCVFDTTAAQAADRVKIYVNGQQVSDFDTRNNPTLNTDYGVNMTTTHRIGSNSFVLGQYLDGYLSDVYFIDGEALDPSYFGRMSSDGIWEPIAYAGTSYGTNGFHLDFADNSTAAALGTDVSGNSNDWTPSGITTDDQVSDTPSVNWATLNFLDKGSTISLADGNLNLNSSGAAWNSVKGSIGVSSGKFYWEINVNTALSSNPQVMLGIGNLSASISGFAGSSSNVALYDSFSGNKFPANTSYGSTYSLNDVIGVALDMDAGTLTFYKNNTSLGQSHSGLTGTWFPFAMVYGTALLSTNFGQLGFAYTPPTGFVALNSANLPAPTITDGKEHFGTVLYTGNGTTQAVQGLEFQPDFVWIKNRSAADDHKLLDAVRGATEELESNTTGAEVTNSDGLTAFNSNGFTVGADLEYNTSGENFVAWNWNAGGSTVTNTDGSITSQVRANTTAGFSIVSYTGNGTAGATVGHGLTQTPEMVIVKRRNNAGGFLVYNKQTLATKYLALNLTAAATTLSTVWNNTEPTSSVFSIGTDAGVNGNTDTFISYCFAGVDGFSKFGSYTGNGSTDGPFIYTGFRPAFVMVKRTDSADGWVIQDGTRNPYNATDKDLYPHVSNAETTSLRYDFLSNGFKQRNTFTPSNASGGTYIYMAFAENPFKTARAR